ncbi:MAG: LptE family protein, partial [Bacteroidales bacterium]|nr:LptE family protein [Bacteroidales bacterium]
SYKFNGAALDYNIYKTVSFGDFPIRAALVYPPLQQLFENKMQDMVTQQTRLRVVDSNNTDLRMEGEITNYSLSPQAVREDAYASQTRLTIAVRVKFIDNKNPALSSDQTFTAYRDFDSNQMLTDVQDELCNQICDDLKDLIFNSTFGNW